MLALLAAAAAKSGKARKKAAKAAPICEDLHTDCHEWAQAGECSGKSASHSQSFMQSQCSLSCATCEKFEPEFPLPLESFEVVDGDGDGTISSKEISKIVSRSASHSRGVKNKLSMEHLATIVDEQTPLILEKLDQDKDGLVSKDEWSTAHSWLKHMLQLQWMRYYLKPKEPKEQPEEEEPTDEVKEEL